MGAWNYGRFLPMMSYYVVMCQNISGSLPAFLTWVQRSCVKYEHEGEPEAVRGVRGRSGLLLTVEQSLSWRRRSPHLEREEGRGREMFYHKKTCVCL